MLHECGVREDRDFADVSREWQKRSRARYLASYAPGMFHRVGISGIQVLQHRASPYSVQLSVLDFAMFCDSERGLHTWRVSDNTQRPRIDSNLR